MGDPQSFTWQADLNQDTKELFEAISKNDLEKTKDLLKKDGVQINTLYSAVLRGQQDIIKLLLANGADINAKNKDGNTPLHETQAAVDAEAIINLLLDNGADINATNNQGNTLLNLFTNGSHIRFVKLLVERGAQRDIKNSQGKTALDLARKSTNPEIKRLLGIAVP
jgi:ankyrin repeat protein